MQLEIERTALKKESDKASKDRLAKLEKDLADLQEKSKKLKAQWQTEKAVVDEIRNLKSAMEMSKEQMEQAKREGTCRRPVRFNTGACRNWRRS